MRPLPGADALPPSARPRSRKSSVDHVAPPSSHVPTAFFMRSEEEMEQSMAASQESTFVGRQGDSTFGVQSLADTLEAAFGPEATPAGEPVASRGMGSTAKPSHRSWSNGSSAGSPKSPESLKSSPIRKLKRKLSSRPSSTSPTPLHADAPSLIPTPAMPSTPTSASLHSLKLSDEESALDEISSQVVTSSGEEEDEGGTEQDALSSFPQLVMPSIQMPTRRPFTAKGKAMGKLKVLVAGEAGIGKTSFIRSIVQICEDIVHVDPLSPSQSFSQPPPRKSKSRRHRTEYGATTRVTEIHASTKACPHWWSDVEESRVLRRRKNSIETILERNICFVDTPGYVQGASEKDDMNIVLEYVESLLHQTSSATAMKDSDVVGMISGSGGISVDAVLYLLPPSQDISKDIDFMQRLSGFTNVIPIIAKSETLSAQEVISLKTTILARLQATSIKPFFFGKPLDDALIAVQGLSVVHQPSTTTSSLEASRESDQYPFTTPTYPYAISSISGPNNDTMDASLLMSPDYVQPLLPSELPVLVDQIFEPESIAWLRHSAAKKFLAWRRRTKLPGDSFRLQTLQQPHSPMTASIGLNGAALNASSASSIFSALSPSGVLVPRPGSPFTQSNLPSPLLASSPSLAGSEALEHPTNLSLARYNTYTQGQQGFNEIHVAKWATDLQRSIRNERDRFEEVQRSERAKWLLERVSEEVSQGTIIASPGAPPRAEWAIVRRDEKKETSRPRQRYGATGWDSKDPLGLCDLSDEVRRQGVFLVKVLGGVGVLGAVCLAVARYCGAEMPEGGVWSWLGGGLE